MPKRTKAESIEWARQNAERARERQRERGVSEEVIAKGEDPDAYLDLYQNNDGELALALGRIRRAMEEQGWPYEKAVRRFGIRGHPYFKDFWPAKEWWGDTRWARERAGLPVD